METEILTETFCRLQKKLHSVAGRMLRDEMEAEDAVQDAFCNLWVKELPVTSDEARFRLFAVLKNICLNKLKRKRPMSGLENIEISVNAHDDYDAEYRRIAVLKQLTPIQREVFRLSVYEELEYEEIAERLGLKIDAVRMHICRARKVLRENYRRLEL